MAWCRLLLDWDGSDDDHARYRHYSALAFWRTVDKFGVSWQIVPEVLPQMLNEKDREKSKRVMEAMMQMVRLDIDELQQAYHPSA
jgi:predicted 3-demethylubiquinone-9 3-methyltransferase (glyoxalase superfamily)